MRLDVANELKKYEGDFSMLNKSELARRLNCDRRTIDRYIEGSNTTRKTRKVKTLLDGFEDIIISKLNLGATIYGVYKFLEKNHGYSGSYQTVYNFSRKYRENESKKATIRYETKPGLQAQVDWKEKLEMISRQGEIFTINIFLLVLGYSRKKIFKVTVDRSQRTLLSMLTESFESLGGIPKEILFDNMKTVVDRTNSKYNKVVINKSFDYFSKDAGFKTVTCRPYRPQTKGKVEALAKLTSRLIPYNGEFDTFEDLVRIVREFNDDINNEVSKATGKTPNKLFEKEKEHLLPLNNLDILKSHFLQEKNYKVSKESMINYKGKKYSVPVKYISKSVLVKESDVEIKIYYFKDLIASHVISDNHYNYKKSHVKEILASDSLKNYTESDIDSFIENNLREMDMFLEMEEI